MRSASYRGVFLALTINLLFAARAESSPADGGECTIAVVAGTATRDGRPLLWKNRDAYKGERADNEVVFFPEGPYPSLALVNAGELKKAWIGVNQRGFAILNAVSYNLPDSIAGGISNGVLMKQALQTCATVEDFETLFAGTNSAGRDNPANFGVLDASGGAAVFEAGSRSYVRFDAADPQAAPRGILVRTNYSLSADTSGTAESFGKYRCHRCRRLLEAGLAAGGVDVPYLLQTVARDLRPSDQDPYPLPCPSAPPSFPSAVGYVDGAATINRRATIAAGAILGVLPGEDPRLATFYAIVSQPVVTIALPLWVAAGPTPAALNGPVTSPLCDLALERVRATYDHPSHRNLINTNVLANPEATGLLDRVEQIEQWLFPETDRLLEEWRREVVDPTRMAMAENQLAGDAVAQYRVGPTPAAGSRLALSTSPNPSSGPTLLHYELPGDPPPDWGMQIFDAQGRLLTRVRRMTPGLPRAGTLIWDGLDDGGRRVPSGVYFFRPNWPPRARGRSFVVVH